MDLAWPNGRKIGCKHKKICVPRRHKIAVGSQDVLESQLDAAA